MTAIKPLPLILLLLPLIAFSQGEGCGTHLSGNDKRDFDKGIEAFNNKRYQQCISLMRKVSAKNRAAADPYFYMGVAEARIGDKPATVRNHFNRLFKLCPDYPNALAYFYMGVVHYTYKQYDEATRLLNRYFDIANQERDPQYDAVYEEASSYLYWSEFLAEAEQNRAPFFPNVVGGASSKRDELLPYLAPDGSQLFFLRMMPAARQKTFYEKTSEGQMPQLFCSLWCDTAFGDGQPLPAPFNQGAQEGSVTLTADGNLLYYSALSHEGGYDNCDIWYCRRSDGKWQPLQRAGRNVNGERTWESQPSISPDGQYLYFASNRPGGQGGTDIWMCRRLNNGDWSRAENLGPAVNTPGNEKSPFLHADGHTLYFASNGWQGFGGYDLYFIDLTNTHLARPTNLGLPINSEDDDVCLGVTTDGKRAYFAGKSTEWAGIGGTDIFFFELYPAAQPEEMSIVGGLLRAANGSALSGVINVLRNKADADRYLVEEGKFALALSARGHNIVIATAEGCLPRVLTGNATQVRRDIQASDFALLQAQLWGRYPLPLPKNTASKSLLPLSDDAKAVLDAYVDFLLSQPRMKIRIEATTLDEAKGITDYLLSRQLRPERLDYKSNGALAAPQIVITEM